MRVWNRSFDARGPLLFFPFGMQILHRFKRRFKEYLRGCREKTARVVSFPHERLEVFMSSTLFRSDPLHTRVCPDLRRENEREY